MSSGSHQSGHAQQPPPSGDRVPKDEDTRVATFDREEPSRAANLSLNDRFVDELGDSGLQAYVEVLVDTARLAASGATPSQVRSALEQSLTKASIDVSPIERDKLADEIVVAQGRVHISAHGRVIYGDSGFDASTHEPTVRGVEDPEDPDRPALT